MPLKRCTTKDGKSGWKAGSKGKCYLKKQDAVKQWYSYAPDEVKKEMSKGTLFENKKEILEIAAELNLSMAETAQLLLQEKNV